MTQELSLEKMPAALVELHNKVDDLTDKLTTLLEAKESSKERLLSATEACKLFVPSISRLTLIRWTKADYLKEYRLGGRIYYRQSEVIEAAKHLEKYKGKRQATAGIMGNKTSGKL